ncbi:hypothetical protein CC99x_009570 [Candidatus Berkiella cookevillensis]|uniref:Uncharacterized protein n=1 Tax=Candidatus Berkiella cookevillensis TaxID=437022 RepID=A0A0Q9YBP2_9GAMM|nr:hypothetical protein [Candidatus Berkiella cookevillensis]MCS5709153.1 hypothetical protein [Candidatus Berkiella cookevillensis]
MSKTGPSQPTEYCFAQQRDSSCHLMPFINLQILNTLRTGKAEDLDLHQKGSWHTKRAWLPETFKHTKSWQKAITALHTVDGPFSKRQKRQLAEGILNGHIYRADGVRVDNTWNPITNYANMMLYPYNFTDANTLPEDLAWQHFHAAFKTLPLFWNDGKALCFDEAQKDYLELTEVNNSGDWDIALPIISGTSMANPTVLEQDTQDNSKLNHSQTTENTINSSIEGIENSEIYSQIYSLADDYWSSVEESYDRLFPATASKVDPGTLSLDYQNNPYHSTTTHRYFKLNPAQKALLDLPEKTVLFSSSPSVLGFEMAFKYRYLPAESQVHSYYMSNLCQLILFGMGLDSNNNPIQEGHPDYDAFIEFREAMSEEKENPWNFQSFAKENFLEYHITEMIKADPNLRKKMEETVSIFFPAWEKYQELDHLYDENHVSLRDKKKELMGEEQYLAYCYVQSARFLWGASVSRAAFNAILELNPTLAHLLRLPLAPGPNQIIRNAQVKINGNSFLDVWKEIQANLVINPNIPKDLASFSGHGIVMSVRNDLFDAQMKAGVQNPKIMNQLGFSIIDSYYGDQLQPMYRRAQANKTPHAACDIQKMTTPEVDTTISLSTTKPYSIRGSHILKENPSVSAQNQSASSKSLAHEKDRKSNKNRKL